jgi:hypothetical protein
MTEPAVASSDASNIAIDIACADRSHVVYLCVGSLVWLVSLLVCVFICLFVCLFACLCVYLLVCVFICLFVCWFACLVGFFACLCVYLLVCLCVRLLPCLLGCSLVCASLLGRRRDEARGEYVINGEKWWITGAGPPQLLLSTP